jgi:hypothetical protein
MMKKIQNKLQLLSVNSFINFFAVSISLSASLLFFRFSLLLLLVLFYFIKFYFLI